MIQYKKIILTLVALLAVTTGAWAESKPIGLNVEYAVGDVITSTTDVYVYYGDEPGTLKKMGVKITSTQPLTIFMIDAHGFGFNGNDAVYYLPVGDATGGSAGVIPCVGESTGDATVVHVASGSGTLTDPYVFGSGPSGTPVPLTRGTGDKINEWTFTMPGGNVTLEPEYYPQATLTAAPTAINDVPATTDGAIVKAGTVANIGTTETAQGTVMYYVSPTALDDAALLALAADQWTADVPTAEKLAQGEAYVYYYVRGNDSDTDEENFSDGDILSANALTVTIAAEPTYAVTFKAANANTIEAGKATVTVGGTDKTVTEGKLQGVKMGSEVKVKANTGYKFRKVEVKKKAAAKPLANATTEDLGKVVGADGKIYATKADAEAVATGNAVAMICYVNEGHGLALALSDEGDMDWNTALTTCAAHTPAVTGATWKLASKSEMNLMINAAGNYAALRDGFSAVGGTNMIDEYYWLSDESSSDYAENFNFSYGSWSQEFKDCAYKVRACLAF